MSRHLVHLEGLRRLSPCCQKRVAHPNPWSAPDPIALICLGCRKPVTAFLLRNRHGQIVWPVDGSALPPAEPRPRRKRRRTHPTEADPEPYPLHLDRRVVSGILR